MRISDWSSDVCSSDLVADVEVGPAQLVIADFEPEAEQAVHDDAIVGDDAVVACLRIAREILVHRRLLKRVAGAPLVADPGSRDDAQLYVADRDGGAAGQPRRPVDRNMVVLLTQRRRRTAEVHRAPFEVSGAELRAPA